MEYIPPRKTWTFEIRNQKDIDKLLADVKLIYSPFSPLKLHLISYMEFSVESGVENRYLQGVVILKEAAYHIWEFINRASIIRSYPEDFYHRKDRTYDPATFFQYGVRRGGRKGKLWGQERTRKLADKRNQRRKRALEKINNNPCYQKKTFGKQIYIKNIKI